MSGESVGTEDQVAPALSALGESMSGQSVLRSAMKTVLGVLAQVVRTIRSMGLIRLEWGRGWGPKVCPEYR
jgi:hypothetical protein